MLGMLVQDAEGNFTLEPLQSPNKSAEPKGRVTDMVGKGMAAAAAMSQLRPRCGGRDGGGRLRGRGRGGCGSGYV